MNWKSFVLPYGANTDKQYAAAAAGAMGGAFGGPAQAYNGYAQGLAGLGTSFANNYGSYAGALGNLAQSQANEEGNKYSSRAMAEAARQGAIGNIGSAALGAYGSTANSAMSAWAQNQAAYNKSLSEMQQANQQGLSNYGMSRNQALGGLASAYGQGGGQLGGAAAVGDISATFGDGGFNASGFNAYGDQGQIASGSYGSPGGFYGSIQRSGNGAGVPAIADQTFGGLDRTRDSLMAGDITSALMRDADLGRKQLDDQHYSSRGMPSQMMDQALGGLMTLSRDGYGTSSGGMNQFYDSVDRVGRHGNSNASILGLLTNGFNQSGQQIGGLRGDMGSGFGNTLSFYDGLMGGSSPAEEVRQNRQAQLLRRRYAAEDAAARRERASQYRAEQMAMEAARR